jgi:glycosyltransferase involved in cell wall biosynthesis
MERGKALVRYVSVDNFGFRDVADIVRSTRHDAIYLNSFFDTRFTQQVLVNHRMRRLSGRPIVLAPRGELSEGALQLKSFKKDIFIRMAKWLKIYDGLTWQASSAREAEDIQRVLSVGERTAGWIVVSGHVAPDVTDPENSTGPSVASVFRYSPKGPLRVCFLSRITPMKNLDFALRVLAQVRVPVRFAIYGPIEDSAYWARCETLIAKLPSNIEVVHEGALEPAQVVPTLAQHDLFFFPTRGENFGHVIHEALRAGLPLLISDKTPWQGLSQRLVGWDLPLNNAAEFAQMVEHVAAWSVQQRVECSSRARLLATEVGNDQAMIRANRRLFLDAIERHQRAGHAVPQGKSVVENH